LRLVRNRYRYLDRYREPVACPLFDSESDRILTDSGSSCRFAARQSAWRQACITHNTSFISILTNLKSYGYNFSAALRQKRVDNHAAARYIFN
jgi:hypothetical protein